MTVASTVASSEVSSVERQVEQSAGLASDSSPSLAVERALVMVRWLALGAATLLTASDALSSIGTLRPLFAVAALDLALTLFTLARPGAASASTGLAALELAFVAAAESLLGGSSPARQLLLLYLPPLVVSAVGSAPTENRWFILAVGLLASATTMGQPIVSPAWPPSPPILSALLLRCLVVAAFGLGATRIARGVGFPRVEAERGESARLVLLNGLLRATSASRDLDHVVAALTATTRRGLRADVAWAALLQTGDRAPRLWISGDLSPDALADVLTALTRRIGSYAQPICSGQSDCAEVADSLRGLARVGLRSVLAAPLDTDQKTFGAIGVAARVSRAFDATSLDWLQAIAHQAGPALHNARLREIELAQIARLAEIERAKSAFLSGISHDLRTPLTALKVATGLLAEQRDDWRDPEQTMLASLQRNAERLERLVDELLDTVRLQGGAIKLQLETLDLAELAQAAALAIQPMLDSRAQSLSLDLPADRALVRADRRRIEQVLTNLLANAQKFSPEGAEILLALAEADGEWIVSVADHGPGVAPDEREKVFEPFYRGENGDQAQGGVGLGLAVARALVELHSGRIWIEPNRPSGAIVKFALPSAATAAPVDELAAPIV